MKIAHVTATFPPYWAGTGNVAYHNARVLQERGHDVTVFTARTSRDGDMDFPFSVRRLPPVFRVGNAPLTPSLLGCLGGFDIIHLHYPYIFGAELVAMAARRYRTPLFITYHQDLLARGLRGLAFRLYATLNQPWTLRQGKQLVATSGDYARHSQLARVTSAAKPAAVVPNGVDTSLFRPGAGTSAWRERLGMDAGTPAVLFVGGLDRAHHFKGVEVLLSALAQLEEVHAVIVGKGELRPWYEARGQDCAPGRVHFVGKLPLEELVAYYQGATVTVLPSTTQGEAFGMVLLESMACGTPVVASNLPGVRTVVEDGVCGRLVPPGDPDALAAALHELTSQPERAEQMGRCGLDMVRDLYDWDVVAERLEQVYEQGLMR